MHRRRSVPPAPARARPGGRPAPAAPGRARTQAGRSGGTTPRSGSPAVATTRPGSLRAGPPRPEKRLPHAGPCPWPCPSGHGRSSGRVRVDRDRGRVRAHPARVRGYDRVRPVPHDRGIVAEPGRGRNRHTPGSSVWQTHERPAVGGRAPVREGEGVLARAPVGGRLLLVPRSTPTEPGRIPGTTGRGRYAARTPGPRGRPVHPWAGQAHRGARDISCWCVCLWLGWQCYCQSCRLASGQLQRAW